MTTLINSPLPYLSTASAGAGCAASSGATNASRTGGNSTFTDVMHALDTDGDGVRTSVGQGSTTLGATHHAHRHHARHGHEQSSQTDYSQLRPGAIAR
jgi:hypothetical protein